MKRIAVLGAILVSGLAAVGVTAQGLPGITDIEQVNGNVYKIWGAGGNTTVFLRENDVVLVDTKLPGSGEEILAQIRKVTDLPIGMIINSHSHPDHTGSNGFFTQGADVQVVAQATAAAQMGAEGGPFPAMKVDQSFEDKLTIGEGKDQIDVYHFGAGHTGGDALVVFPAEGTMAAGDIYAWHMSPLIDPGAGGSILALPTSLTKALYTIKGVDKVIAGHGAVRTWDEFQSYTMFHRALVDAAVSAAQFGGSPATALASLDNQPSFGDLMGEELMPGLEYGGTPRSRVYGNLKVAFQELKGEEVQLIMGTDPSEVPAKLNGDTPRAGAATAD